MKHWFRFLGATLLIVATPLSFAQEAPPVDERERAVPDALKPWIGWATWEDQHRKCPTPYSNADKHLCFWPSRLDLQVDAKEGRFGVNVVVYHETWVPLPGDAIVWPLELKANGAPVPVVERNGAPAIRLAAGTHTVSGVYRWNEMPQKITLPAEIGILSLTVAGQAVESPAWNQDGVLWLKRDGASEEADKDFISAKVYSVLEDGIPLWLRTEVELIVSGKSREEELGTILPEGWKLAVVESGIPVAVDDAGRLKAQVRAGKWTVRAEAFRTDNPKEIRYAEGATVAATEQLLAYRSQPDLRVIEIVGAPSIDVSQTTFPEKWRELPVYQWETKTVLTLEERLRGMGEQKPAGLTISRQLWLDEDGRGLTFRDEISGAMQQIWRLDVAPEQNLGSVRADGEGQLITRNPATGTSGVELRSRMLKLQATGRMERGSPLSATGWNSDAEKVGVTLNLPPGWRLFALFGADWVQGDWLTAWTLLDLFLLLIFSLAVFRLWGPLAGVLAFAAFGFTYHEPGAPRFAWLLLLVPLALLRVVPEGWSRRAVLAGKWIVVGVLVLLLVPFFARQVQQALYPQLEDTISRSLAFSSVVPLAAAEAEADWAAPATAAAPMPTRAEALGDSEVERKLERIVIPRIDFREMTLQQALDYVQQQSVAFDTEEPDPAKKGVRIVSRLEPSPGPGAPVIPGLEGAVDSRITVELTNIPLGEVIRYVTGLANMNFRVEGNQVLVVPQGTPTDSVITKEIAVLPGVVGLPPVSGYVSRSSAQPTDVQVWFEEQGVPFPPGSSAVYLPDRNRLIVRNTQENLDLIVGIVSSGAVAWDSSTSGRNLEYDAAARIQTGPGVPQWTWRTVGYGWNGPVQASQQVRPILIPSSIGRVLSVLRVGLLLALAGVLLGARAPRAFWRRGATGGAAAVFLGAALLLGGAAPAAAQIPDQQTLQTLRERLVKAPDAYPRAADIPSVALTLNDRRLTLEAEVHTAVPTAVPIPGRLPAWSPISVQVNGKPEPSLRRQDGYLWVSLPAGVHRVLVEGSLAELTEWEWSFLLKPRRVAITAPGWNVSGVRPDGTPEQQVFFARQQPAATGESSYDRQDLQTLALVDRRLELGLFWQVRTTVSRLSPSGKAMVLRVPLLPGENVLSPDAVVQDGVIEVRLGAQEDMKSWESRLPVGNRLALATRAEDTWVERWTLVASPVWNVELTGLAPIFDQQRSELIPVWQPWPGESVELAISRPEAITGANMTVDLATHEVRLGSRQRTSQLGLTLRSSLGEDFLLNLPSDAEITSLSRNGSSLPVRKDGGKVVIPLRPGEQKLSVEWKLPRELGFAAAAENVQLPVEAANVSTTIVVPENRWVLWTHGPLRGPAVRFWSILIFALLVAWTLARLSISPLRAHEWMLLVIGLTQVPLPAAIVVVAWFFLLAWRGSEAFLRLKNREFNVLQVLLIGTTAVALSILVFVVAEGLLGRPEMFIVGNGSNQTHLRWYQPRTDSLLPTPGCVSVSIWWYRFLMLAWALWLAASLIRWLRWGWGNFSKGGLIRRTPKAITPPPPLPTRA
jgi:hypothetical protein